MPRRSSADDSAVDAPLVACVGIATLDTILGVPALPSGDGKWSATWMIETGGGVAANAAVAISRLGGRARFIGCVGSDLRGQHVKQGLASEGVLVDHVHQISGQPTPTSAVVVDDRGDRMIVNHLAPDFFELAAAQWATSTDDANAVLVDLRWLAGAAAALSGAKRAGVPGIVDVDRPVSPDAEVLTRASHLVFSRDAVEAMTHTHQPEDALRTVASWTDAWCGVTLGSDGVTWLESGRLRRLPAYDITALDTLGAGDTFHGAFALALAEGCTENEALRFANAAAAMKCLSRGGRAGMPHRADVQRFMAKHEPQHL